MEERFKELARKYGFRPVLLHEILWCLINGYTRKKIGEQTGISQNTIAKYLNIFSWYNYDTVIEFIELVIISKKKELNLVDDSLLNVKFKK